MSNKKAIQELCHSNFMEWLIKARKIYEASLTTYINLQHTLDETLKKYKSIDAKKEINNDLELSEFKYDFNSKITVLHRKYMELIYTYIQHEFYVDLSTNQQLINDNSVVINIKKRSDEEIEKMKKRFKTEDVKTETVERIIKNTPVSYLVVIRDILDQCDGLSLSALRQKQVKTRLHRFAHNKFKKKNDVEILKNKVIMHSIAVNTNYYKDVCMALKDLNNGKAVLQYHEYGLKYNDNLEYTELIAKNGLIDKVKYYKNDRCDLIFTDEKKAKEFACEWCGISA